MLKKEFVEMVAFIGHEQWREDWKSRNNGVLVPRPKKTTDQNWIEENGTEQIDIATHTFEQLPLDWQADSLASADIAVTELLAAAQIGDLLDEVFVERTAEKVHVFFVGRRTISR